MIAVRFEPASLGGALTGIVRFVRDVLTDRPSVRIIGRVVDHGAAVKDIGSAVLIRGRSGVSVDLEIHSTGAQPVQPTEAGLVLDNGTRVAFSGGDLLPKVIARPEFVERHEGLATVKEEVALRGARRATRFYVKATPDREFRQGLPVGWDNFPNKHPDPQRT